MPRPATYLHISQPCAESWGAMQPVSGGRHCAACAKTVVDFTSKTDAELLAYLRRAAGGELCGRLRHDQLLRPLQPALPTNPAGRWRAWLALALAVWGAGRVEAAPRPAPQPSHHLPPRSTLRQRRSSLAVKQLRGTVRDSASGQPLVGVAVFLRGENRQARTDSAGRFQLPLPPRRPRSGRALVLHFAGYQSATVRVPASTRATPLQLALAAERGATEVEVTGYSVVQRHDVTGGIIAYVSPEPLKQPPTLWQRLTRPFRHAQSGPSQ